jgi:hypothetical protein
MKGKIKNLAMNLALAVSAYLGIVENHQGAFNIAVILTWVYFATALLVFVTVHAVELDQKTLDGAIKIGKGLTSKLITIFAKALDVTLVLSFAYIGEFTLSVITTITIVLIGSVKIKIDKIIESRNEKATNE